MNLDRIQTAAIPPAPIGATRPKPRRLDLTSAEPAVPGPPTRGGPSSLGSIQGVLTADEERAIADMFAPARGGYNRAGSATKPPAVPGTRLNLQA